MKMDYKFLVPLIVVLGLLVWLINLALTRFVFDAGATLGASANDVWVHIIQTSAVVLAALIVFGVALSRLLATRRRLEAELREREERYRSLFEQSPIGIGTATIDGKVLDANEAMTHITGYSLEELRSINLADTYENPEDRSKLVEKLNHDGGVTDYAVRLKRKDGMAYDALLNMVRINMNGHSIFQTTQVDITEQKQAQQALVESEANYRELANSITDLFFAMDSELRYTYWNKASEELTGIPAKDALGKSLYDIFPASEATKRAAEVYLTVLQTKQPHHFINEYQLGGKDFTFEISAYPTSQGLSVFARDITDRKQAEEKYQTIVQTAMDGFWLADMQGRFLEVNDAYCQLIGYSRDELLKMSIPDIEAIEKPEETGARIAKIRKTGGDRFETRHRCEDGRIVDVEISVNYVGAGSGRMFVFIRDITERKQMQEAVQKSEEKYRSLVENCHAGIATSDLEGKLTFVNSALCGMIGYTSDELLGKSFLVFTSPDERAKIEQIFLEAVASPEKEKVIYLEFKVVHKDGRLIDLYASATALKYQDKLTGALSVITDITQRKQAEQMYRILAMRSPVGIYIAQDGKFVFANPQFQKDIGLTEEELLGRDPLSLVHPEDRESVRQNAVEMLKGKRLEPYEFRSIIKTGETKWALESVTSIIYRGKEATLGNFMDITERKQAEEKERLLEEELGRTARLVAVGELAAGVAHELNNPLTGILGFSERLLRKSTDEQTTRYMERINSEAARAARVVQNLMTFARRQPPKKTYADINEIVLKALELRAYELKSGGIAVSTNLTPGLPKVLADFQQIQQVFLNIIINAEQAMNEANVAGRLAIETLNADSFVQISFSDSGPGIPEEYLGRIFDPFFTTRADRGGTGLGLSLSYGILAEHGGRIYARSQPGQGATFVIELPVT